MNLIEFLISNNLQTIQLFILLVEMNAVEDAKKLCRQKNYGKAESVLKQYLTLQDKDAQAYFQMGVVLKKMRQMDASIGYLTICLDLQPNHRQAKQLLISILVYNEQYQQAAKLAKQCLEKNKNDFTINLLLARIYQKSEDYQLAKSHIEKCLRINPNQNTCQDLLKSINHRVSRLNAVKKIETSELKLKIGQLQKRYDEIKSKKSEEGLCVTCFQYKACFAAKECGHCCVCQQCAYKISKQNKICPMCRKSNVNFIKIVIG